MFLNACGQRLYWMPRCSRTHLALTFCMYITDALEVQRFPQSFNQNMAGCGSGLQVKLDWWCPAAATAVPYEAFWPFFRSLSSQLCTPLGWIGHLPGI